MKLFEIESLPLLDKYKSAVQVAVEKYRKNQTVIYRGIRNVEYTDDPVSYVDPTKRSTPRRSAYTHNYYTLWMDNHPAWKQYPKRSYSISCTTDLEKTEDYGDPMVVVPLQATTIGICPESDLWYSFEQTLPVGETLKGFMDWIHYNFYDQDIAVHRSLNYSELIAALKQLNVEKLKDDPFSKIFKQYGALGAFEYILDPVKNQFRAITWQQFTAPPNREVWLSAPCLYITETVFSKLLK